MHGLTRVAYTTHQALLLRVRNRTYVRLLTERIPDEFPIFAIDVKDHSIHVVVAIRPDEVLRGDITGLDRQAVGVGCDAQAEFIVPDKCMTDLYRAVVPARPHVYQARQRRSPSRTSLSA